MFKRFRQLRISLAAKCQILFGAAVVLIIGAALFVPWQRMEALMDRLDFQAAKALADHAVMDHIARESVMVQNGMTRPSDSGEGITFPATLPISPEMAGYQPPRLIPVNPPKSMHITHFENKALVRFTTPPDVEFYNQAYQSKGVDRYRFAQPLYATQSCLPCHTGSATTAMAAMPPASPDGGAPSDSSSSLRGRLLGIVSIDITSQIDANQVFINRLFILAAGLLAGTLAIAVFYVITTRLILQPVRVLQETAEKVSEGDLNIRSDISTGDEFQQLSETFNTMLSNLKQSADQLRSINKGLDLKLGQLSESNVALYESNRLKSEFLANVSHELRTPLNSILGFAELLKDTVGGSSDGKSIRYLQNILTSGRNLLDLINDLLDLAKIEAGRMEVRSEPLSLGDMFEGLSNILKPLSEAKDLEIVTSVAPEVPIITTDPAKLQQVLYNLLSNAIKFSPNGGKVDLAAQREDEQTVRISVTDRGPGIHPDKQSIIFEKFRQLDASVTREHGGTGLGLAICRELTGLLGGSMGVDSVPGEGAVFWVLLPLQISSGARDLRTKLTLS